MSEALKVEAATEESKTEAVTVKVTPSTLRSLQLVAQVHNCPVGPMLLARSVHEIEIEAEEIRAKVRPTAVPA